MQPRVQLYGYFDFIFSENQALNKQAIQQMRKKYSDTLQVSQAESDKSTLLDFLFQLKATVQFAAKAN